MVFCVVADGTVNDCENMPACDIAVFGLRGLGEVDYENELKGISDKFEETVRFSKKEKCGVLCGCRTNSRGILRKSVSVADKGKLLGISDMNHVIDTENFKSGAGLGVYTVSGYKIGICVENDLLFPDGFKAFSAYGCNAVVVFLEELKNTLPPLLIRAYSYLFGVPIVMCAGNMAFCAEITGEIASSSQKYSLFDIDPRSHYHVVTTRTKGLFPDISVDY